jgi:hypothetical protein
MGLDVDDLDGERVGDNSGLLLGRSVFSFSSSLSSSSSPLVGSFDGSLLGKRVGVMLGC